jgi:Ca2+-binding RTX toxin-like protein
MLALALLLLIPLALDVALLDQSLDALRGDDDTGDRSEDETTDEPPQTTSDTIRLGDQSDDFEGSFRGETIFGNLGDDKIDGRGGDDTLFGSSGNDLFDGGAGDDALNGNVNDDILAGGPGADTLRGGNNDDTLFGDSGSDLLLGETGDDVLIGGGGTDALWGGAIFNNDTLETDNLSALQSGPPLITRPEGETPTWGGNFRDDGVEDKLTGGAGTDTLFLARNDIGTGGGDADEFILLLEPSSDDGSTGETGTRVTDFSNDDVLMIATQPGTPDPAVSVTQTGTVVTVFADDFKVAEVQLGPEFDENAQPFENCIQLVSYSAPVVLARPV